GIVALLHRRVEGVAVDMGKGKRLQFRVAQNSRAAARSAAPLARSGAVEAVAANAWHSGVDDHVDLSGTHREQQHMASRARRQEKRGDDSALVSYGWISQSRSEERRVGKECRSRRAPCQ